jgi:hypothetical protein
MIYILHIIKFRRPPAVLYILHTLYMIIFLFIIKFRTIKYLIYMIIIIMCILTCVIYTSGPLHRNGTAVGSVYGHARLVEIFACQVPVYCSCSLSSTHCSSSANEKRLPRAVDQSQRSIFTAAVFQISISRVSHILWCRHSTILSVCR